MAKIIEFITPCAHPRAPDEIVERMRKGKVAHLKLRDGTRHKFVLQYSASTDDYGILCDYATGVKIKDLHASALLHYVSRGVPADYRALAAFEAENLPANFKELLKRYKVRNH